MIQGLYTALITPFQEDYSLDLQALIYLIKHQITGGVDGITLLGTTGEAPTIEDDERECIVKECIQTADGAIQIMVGCSSNSTKKAVCYARQAEAWGADSLLIATPYYNRPTQDGIFEHFKAISEAVSIPICIYNIPSRTAQNIETATIERLSHFKNIKSVKESSGNLVQVQDVIETIVRKKNDFSLLSGDDIMTLPVLSVGGHGIISVISNLIPETVAALVEKWVEGNIEEAQNIHYSIKQLIQHAFIETNPAPIKYMLSKIHPIQTTLRLPLVQMGLANKQKIDMLLEKVNMYATK